MPKVFGLSPTNPENEPSKDPESPYLPPIEKVSNITLTPPLSAEDIEHSLSYNPFLRVYLEALPELVSSRAKLAFVGTEKVVAVGNTLEELSTKINSLAKTPSEGWIREIEPLELISYFRFYHRD